MKIALLRVGIDTGAGGIHGPLFRDGSFEYVPIPDGFGVDERTYHNFVGSHGKALIEYFPYHLKARMTHQSLHFDPEFITFTYGDPTPPKAGLRNLNGGDLLVFYCGLEGWDFESAPALYVFGYFEVLDAGFAINYSDLQLTRLFSENFHVRHYKIFQSQKDRLVLVKGTQNSRLLRKPFRISIMGKDRSGKPLKVLSPEMRRIFGDFNGKISIQRSPTRWVNSAYIHTAAKLIHSLE
jgi:hypothetical protein